MLQASTTARFNPATGRVPDLKLAYGGNLRDFNSFAFQLFPDVRARVTATSGSVEEERGGRVLRDVMDSITFNGSDTASAEYPVEELVSSEAFGDQLDEQGRPTSVTLYADPDTKKLRASKPCYASFLVKYNTSYRQYYYVYPDPDGAYGNYTQLASFYEGGVQFLGKILAFYEGATASLKVEQLQFDQSGQQPGSYRELYRVTSEYVADSDGAWEVPPGWPGENTYGTGEEGPDNSSYQQLQRVHEIGYMDDRGRVDIRPFTVLIEQPYGGSSGYRPSYTLTTSGSVPSEILSSIQSRYPGVA